MEYNIRDAGISIKNAALSSIIKESPKNVMQQYFDNVKQFIQNSSYSILAMGKAAVPMFEGLDSSVKKNSALNICLSPENEKIQNCTCLKGNHPFPGEDTFRSTELIIEHIKNDKSNKLIFLLSGGTSSLFEKPIQSIGNKKYLDIMKKIVDGGYAIDQINAIRCMISEVKCGKCVNLSKYESILILAISDVPGDDISIIGSNPFYPTRVKKLSDSKILKEFDLALEEIKFRECKIDSEIILTGEIYAKELLDSVDMDIPKFYMGSILEGDVSMCSKNIVSMLRKKYADFNKPFLFSMNGETTAKVTGDGKGGRNCLLSTLVLDEMNENEQFVFLSLATDGQDGNSELAGFIVDSSMKSSITKEILKDYMDRSDTGSLAIKYKGALKTGRTKNNVSDVVIGFYSGA
jgi:glycerate-2-kinase